MICLSKGSRCGVQVKACLEGKECACSTFCILEVCRALLSDEQFSVFPDDHGGVLRALLELPLFQGETGLYIDEWTGLSLPSCFLQFLL